MKRLSPSMGLSVSARRIIADGWVIVVLLILAGCESAPLDYPKEQSVAITNTADTYLGLEISKWLDGRTNVNGFYPLLEGFDAFGTRLLLLDDAELSIDVQYFLLKADDAGYVFASGLLKAANRGVRVRVLLDDIFTSVKDVGLATFNDHPNIEVRIFNPIARRGIDAFNYFGNFSLTNRRMHNKAFVVDNQIAVVGGRNIAEEYFQLKTSGEFFDFDMLAVGPIVRDVSNQFDIYWNHELAVPIEALIREEDQDKRDAVRTRIQRYMEEAGGSIYADAINTPLLQQLDALSLFPYIGESRLITDDPQKLLEEVSDDQQIVANEIRELLRSAEHEVYIFTPYFIPRKDGIELIYEMRSKGVRIVLMTNSLATNNHTAVHSSYASYRKDVLRAGVELWEVRADAAKFTGPEGEAQLERMTLHTKAILIDSRRLFVGSLNLDPRSFDLNTEMGLLIDSPELGAFLEQEATARLTKLGYRVKIDDDDNLTWHATIDGKEVVETKEPQTSGWDRFKAWFLKIAPENQL